MENDEDFDVDQDYTECTRCHVTMELETGKQWQEAPELRVCNGCAHELHEQLRELVRDAWLEGYRTAVEERVSGNHVGAIKGWNNSEALGALAC